MGGRVCKEIIDNMAAAAGAAFHFSLTLASPPAEPIRSSLALVVTKSLCLGPTIALASSEGEAITPEMAQKVQAATDGWTKALRVGGDLREPARTFAGAVDYVLDEVGYGGSGPSLDQGGAASPAPI